MGHLLNHDNLGDVQKTVYLAALVSTIDPENDTMQVYMVESRISHDNIPVFYHCKDDVVRRSNGALEGATDAFEIGDEVIVRSVVPSPGCAYEPLFVIGFTDKPKPCARSNWVVVRLLVGSGTERCFVWDVALEGYALDVPLKDGSGMASFPCDPEDIIVGENAGSALYGMSDCGRGYCSASELGCVGAGIGDWGTVGSITQIGAAPSNCDDAFEDTGTCTQTWSFANICVTQPEHDPPVWIYSGSHSSSRESHVLLHGSLLLVALNDSGAICSFKKEGTLDTAVTGGWSSDGGGCELACANDKIDGEVLTQTEVYHAPLLLGDDLFGYVDSFQNAYNMCAQTGAFSQQNHPTESGRTCLGTFDADIITQIYAIECRTRTMVMNGTMRNPGGSCVGGNCSSAFEEFTDHRLSIAAQVGRFKPTPEEIEDDIDGTAAVDPSGLPRNNLFESAINTLYYNVRGIEGTPDDERLGIIMDLSIRERVKI